MRIEDMLPLIDYKISEGTDYLWPCFGENCRQLHFLDVQGRDFGELVHNRAGDILFIAFTYIDNSKYTAYHWVDPAYREAYSKECETRHIDTNRYDSANLSIELEVEQDALSKISAIYRLEPFDKRILISVDLPEKTIAALTFMAQLNNRSIDDEVCHLLSEYLKKQ